MSVSAEIEIPVQAASYLALASAMLRVRSGSSSRIIVVDRSQGAVVPQHGVIRNDAASCGGGVA
jgi:hypothetical protein